MKSQFTDFKSLAGQLKYDCNRRLCEFFSGFDQERIAVDRKKLVQLTHPTWKCKGWSKQRHFFLPVKKPASVKPKFACSAEMREFYEHFDGLLEEKPPISAGFFRVKDVPQLQDYLPPDTVPDLADVLEAPVVFRAATGDWIFWSENDGFLWYQIETGIPIFAGQTFAELLGSWIKHHQVRDCHPFDSFGR